MPNHTWPPGQLQTIINEVAAKHKVSVKEMCQPSHAGYLCRARQEYFYRASMETGVPHTGIGRKCNRDHSTVLAGIARYCLINDAPPPRKMNVETWWSKWRRHHERWHAVSQR